MKVFGKEVKMKILWRRKINLQFLHRLLCQFNILENIYIESFSKCLPEPVDNKKGNRVTEVVIKTVLIDYHN